MTYHLSVVLRLPPRHMWVAESFLCVILVGVITPSKTFAVGRRLGTVPFHETQLQVQLSVAATTVS